MKKTKRQVAEEPEEVTYTVDSIIADRITVEGVREYYTRWVGYGDDENTWEPAKSFEKARAVLNDYIAEKKRQTEIQKPRKECSTETKRRSCRPRERKYKEARTVRREHDEVQKLTRKNQENGMTYYKAYEAAQQEVVTRSCTCTI